MSASVAASAFAGLLAACTTRELPTRYPETVPASPAAPAPRAPAVATALSDEPGATSAPGSDAAAPPHQHGAHDGH